jgi:hypothetical protein
VTTVPAAGPESPAVRQRAAIVATAAPVFALPAILGGVGSLLPAVIYPDGRMPMSTAVDRAFVYAFSWSALLALVSPPATLLAISLAIWLARSTGWRSPVTRVVAAIVFLAVALSIATGWLAWAAMEAHPEFRQGIPNR